MRNIQLLFSKYVELEIQMPGLYKYIYRKDILILTLRPGQIILIRPGHANDITYIGVAQ